MTTSKEVAALLAQYKDYLSVQAEIDSLDSKKMAAAAELSKRENKKISEILKNKSAFPIFARIEKEEIALRKRLQEISDEMTFANPVVWMMYKYLAYQGTGSAISTLLDMKKHCSKPGYICTKRFDYLNLYLKSQKGVDLKDITKFPDDMKMPDIYESRMMLDLLDDEIFMSGWKKYEYHKDGPRVAKWENYD